VHDNLPRQCWRSILPVVWQQTAPEVWRTAHREPRRGLRHGVGVLQDQPLFIGAGRCCKRMRSPRIFSRRHWLVSRSTVHSSFLVSFRPGTSFLKKGLLLRLASKVNDGEARKRKGPFYRAPVKQRKDQTWLLGRWWRGAPAGRSRGRTRRRRRTRPRGARRCPRITSWVGRRGH
jgi:hypothetical protein